MGIDSKQLESKAGNEKKCLVCGEPLSGKIVDCIKCKTPHHADCWRYNRGCSTYGCSSLTYEHHGQSMANDTMGSTIEMPVYAHPNVRLLFFLFPFLFILVSIFLAPFMKAAIGPMMVLYILSHFLISRRLSYLLDFDEARRKVRLQLKWRNRVLWSDDDWLSADDITEVHLQRYGRSKRGEVEAVYLALTDGSRKLVVNSRARILGFQTPELSALAEKLASFADTTVRFVEGRAEPSSEELIEIAEEQRLIAEKDEEQSP